MFSYATYAKMRDARNITDYRVAKQTGLTTAMFSNWKNGGYTPKVDKVKKIADFFGVTVDYFVSAK